MTTEHEASRTLVKSPPELWAECSESGSLARHLGEFGEIKITRLEPESTVAWEGEHASGTVRIEPSGWGTRVTLTAQTRVEAQDDPPTSAEATDVQPPPAATPPEGDELPDVESLTPEPEIPTPPEESNAAMEETLEGADPEPADEPGRPRARWRRLKARMRGVFGADGRPEATAPPEPAEPEEPDEPEEPESLGLPAEISAPDPAQPEDPKPEPVPDPEPLATPMAESTAHAVEIAEPEIDAEAVLASALDSLGQAHHRPFSRA